MALGCDIRELERKCHNETFHMDSFEYANRHLLRALEVEMLSDETDSCLVSHLSDLEYSILYPIAKKRASLLVQIREDCESHNKERSLQRRLLDDFLAFTGLTDIITKHTGSELHRTVTKGKRELISISDLATMQVRLHCSADEFCCEANQGMLKLTFSTVGVILRKTPTITSDAGRERTCYVEVGINKCNVGKDKSPKILVRLCGESFEKVGPIGMGWPVGSVVLLRKLIFSAEATGEAQDVLFYVPDGSISLLGKNCPRPRRCQMPIGRRCINNHPIGTMLHCGKTPTGRRGCICSDCERKIGVRNICCLGWGSCAICLT